MTHEILLFLHVIGATVLLGTGAGIAFFMVISNRSRDAALVAHVAGIVALMLEKNPNLTQAEVESILKKSAIRLPPGCRTVRNAVGTEFELCWDDQATGSGFVTADRALKGTPRPRGR